MKLDPILYDLYVGMHDAQTISLQCFCKEWINVTVNQNSTLETLLDAIERHEHELHNEN